MARRIGALIFAASLVAGTAGAQTPSSSMGGPTDRLSGDRCDG